MEADYGREESIRESKAETGAWCEEDIRSQKKNVGTCQIISRGQD